MIQQNTNPFLQKIIITNRLPYLYNLLIELGYSELIKKERKDYVLPKGSNVDGLDVTDVAMFTHIHMRDFLTNSGPVLCLEIYPIASPVVCSIVQLTWRWCAR
jgi:hypothetical protein